MPPSFRFLTVSPSWVRSIARNGSSWAASWALSASATCCASCGSGIGIGLFEPRWFTASGLRVCAWMLSTATMTGSPGVLMALPAVAGFRSGAHACSSDSASVGSPTSASSCTSADDPTSAFEPSRAWAASPK